MKRKLIKRNKDFMSSRYTKHQSGTYSFQKTYEFKVFRWKDSSFRFATKKVTWCWSLSSEFLHRVFGCLEQDNE